MRNAGKGFLWEGGFLVILGGFMGEKEGLEEDAATHRSDARTVRSNHIGNYYTSELLYGYDNAVDFVI